nr:nucleoside triphosphate pyrophosphatase [Eubacteriales bacterium]
MRLVLASSSQRRRELMSMCGYDYEIVVSNADENIVEHDPQKLVSALAEKKAREVYDRLIAEGADPSELAVVGSDTVVAFNGEIIGKPRDEKDAVGILKKLSGNTHTVHTGIAVISPGSVQQDVSTTEVRFCTLADDEINAYV